MAAKRGRPPAETAASYFAREGLEELKAYAAERGMGVRKMLDTVREFDKLIEHGAATGRDVEYVSKKNGKRRVKNIPGMLVSFEEQREQFGGPRESLEYCLWAVRFMQRMRDDRIAEAARVATLPGPKQLANDLAARRKLARDVSRQLASARRKAKHVTTIADELESRHRTWNTCEGIVLLIEAALKDCEADRHRPEADRRWNHVYGEGGMFDLLGQLRLAVAALKHATQGLDAASRWLKHSPSDTPYRRGKRFKDEPPG